MSSRNTGDRIAADIWQDVPALKQKVVAVHGKEDNCFKTMNEMHNNPKIKRI
jgi:hypothetical protein